MAVIRTDRGHGLAFGIRCVSRVKKDTVGVRCSCNISIDSAGNRGQYGDEWLFEDTIEKAPIIIERSNNE